MLDVHAIRLQFPALAQDVNGEQLVYLDSAATTQKPDCVISAISHYYRSQNANVHRGSHSLTAQATSHFEAARQTVADFIGAQNSKEIIWTRGATEALNLIAQTYARNTLQRGDEILVSGMEHHANIVPWQIVAEQTGAKVVKVPMTDNCQWNMAAFSALLSDKTKLVALAHITNVTGTRLPIESVIAQAHQVGAKVVVDGAQGIVHETIDVKALDADFYVFSGHKLYAPAGIGVLYGKLSLLDAMPPWHGGGKMVDKVSFAGTTFSELPGKFEAGTPNVAGVIALATAIDWYQCFEQADVKNHIRNLVQNAYQRLSQIDDVKVLGYQQDASLLSFIIDGVHHQDLATLLDQQGIAVRAGHHCAHPLMDALGVKGTVRASFAIYNTQEDVDRLVAAVEKAVDML
ncbi:cysteine desulfurase CsdA [Vibrio neptunius]|uniref:Probable cysteine desulfurase n=1 Tax=Vibrio neptunius TaxID=170651 RepID=A0ABS2ZVL5_9VIBR|nr:cysteine desulfurase CsdA [Vibrio neptunius]MBN3491454.1 cysteine desulfurase CsdA [Vibrio neptunius]MBN3513804.1 cysteine desulfurase CsdA [Vibrio neptunius]MBN3548145.1 cysteine desulfurase CsdA [Vibrio neptunius]MBN3576268.1 cysteine desulfurase CsdA [Vibrio neptunius]MCH9869932.1 cysteine desulfurase CsdA [Vibrio neptunius]